MCRSWRPSHPIPSHPIPSHLGQGTRPPSYAPPCSTRCPSVPPCGTLCPLVPRDLLEAFGAHGEDVHVGDGQDARARPWGRCDGAREAIATVDHWMRWEERRQLGGHSDRTEARASTCMWGVGRGRGWYIAAPRGDRLGAAVRVTTNYPR